MIVWVRVIHDHPRIAVGLGGHGPGQIELGVQGSGVDVVVVLKLADALALHEELGGQIVEALARCDPREIGAEVAIPNQPDRGSPTDGGGL